MLVSFSCIIDQKSVAYSEFENLVNLAIECKKSEVKMEQIKKTGGQNCSKVKTVYTLKNNLDRGRILKKGMYDSLAYGYK